MSNEIEVAGKVSYDGNIFSVTVPQLAVVTFVGILGGVYIWKPLLVKFKAEQSGSSSGATPAAE